MYACEAPRRNGKVTAKVSPSTGVNRVVSGSQPLKSPAMATWRAPAAVKTKRTSTLRCSSGGDNTLLYNPALKVGNALQSLGSDDGCWLLIEGKVK